MLFTFPQKIYFLEISCPEDVNVSSKEEEKTCKYIPLAKDFHLMYHITVEMIPIAFGHTGVVSTDCVKHLRKIPGYCESLLRHYKRLPSLEVFTLCEYKLLELYLMYLYMIWLIIIHCICILLYVATCYSIMSNSGSSGCSCGTGSSGGSGSMW